MLTLFIDNKYLDYTYIQSAAVHDKIRLMGNESSKSKENRSSNNRTTDGASSNAVQRLQKAIPAVIKSGTSGGPSSSQLQRHLEQARKSKTLKLKGAGIKAIPPIIVEV
jgi:hypothetical protein